MSAAIEIRGARVRLGDHEALRGVDLDVASGTYHVLVGPSGSGKTTLLRAIAGFQRVASGEVHLEGRLVSGPSAFERPERRGVGMVFQGLALWPHLSAAGHLEFVLRAHGVPRADRTRRAAEWLDVVRLSDRASHRPSELSGGEAQRLALARALAGEPRVLLLDEPLGSVDPVLREELALELRALQRRLGLAFLHVTHDQSEALAVADRVSVVSAGRIEQTASPEEMLRRPATAFVARFVGRMCVLPAEAGDGTLRTPLGAIPNPNGLRGAVDVAFPLGALALAAEGVDALVEERWLERRGWMHRVAVDGHRVEALLDEPHEAGARVRLRVVGPAHAFARSS